MSEEAKGWMMVGELTELLGRAEPSMRVRITVGTAEHDVDDDGTGFIHGSGEFHINAGEPSDGNDARDAALWHRRWEEAEADRTGLRQMLYGRLERPRRPGHLVEFAIEHPMVTMFMLGPLPTLLVVAFWLVVR